MAKKVEELWVLGGVTAAGKTQLSLEWAEKHNAEIISCDSVSFYRGLDIGSAKPSSSEQERVVHHGLDLVDVTEVFNVGRFHAYAKETIEDILSRGKKVLVVGGSGFFLHGFLRPVIDSVEVSVEIRNKVQKIFESKGVHSLIKKLEIYNPDGLGNLDVNNPVRVIRALERCMQSGHSLMVLQKNFERLTRPYDQFEKKMIWLDREDQEIMERINKRTQKMIDEGMIEETKEAIARGIENHPSLAEAVGYREIIEFLKRGGSKDELIRSIAKSTRQLVSKQRKWFRKHFPVSSCLQLSQKNFCSIEAMPWVAGT